jgi:arylsulfatase A-like enzyme
MKGRWLIAAWLGAAAGLFDATAAFLHPVAPQLLLFSPLVYAVVTLAIFAVATGIAHEFRRRDSGVPLGVTAGVLVLFFGGYFVTTSTARAFNSRGGLIAGLLGCGVLALAVLALVWRLDRQAVRRRGRAGGARRGRLWLGAAPLLAILAAYLALAGAELARSGRAAAGEKAPRGFVLVSLDAARGDRLSCLGYPRPTTPNIDALAAGGTAFRRAYVQIPESGAGHACMLTGLPPISHGVLFNTGVLDARVLTLAERMRAAGFHTAGFVDNYYLDARFGFDQGFDTYIDQYRASHLAGWDPRRLLRGVALYHAWIRFSRVPGAPNDDTIDLTLDWLRHRPRGDFFIFLHIMDPHSPYDPPADIRREFVPSSEAGVHDTEALRMDMGRLSDRQITALRDLYDGDVALADRKVGRLVAELRRLGLFDSTLLVITADHGEVLYEKDRTFDHGLIWNGDLHVPLVFSYPGHVPAGVVADEPVAATSIAATACALLGVPYEEQTGAAVYHALLGAPTGGRVASDSIVCSLAGLAGGGTVAAATGPRYKLIVWPDRPSLLYDLRADAEEFTDLWPPQDPALIATADSLNADLRAWLASCRDHRVGRPLEGGNIDRETRRRLRALGYVN